MTHDPSIGVIALVPDGWRHIVMPRHQVLRRLASHYRVVWIEPPRGWRDFWLPGGARFMKGDQWMSPIDGLDVFTAGWRHPVFLRPAWLARWMLRSRLAAARRHLLQQGARKIVLYLWRHEFADAIDLVPHDASCYHIDDEYSFDERDAPNPTRELDLLRRVDQVIVHSPALLAKKGGVNPHTARVPNGVDYKSYASSHPEPDDLKAVPHPRIGYSGVIKKQLDLALLVRLARLRPDYSFVLVGPILNVSGKESFIEELRQLPNVFLLGGKANEALPAYVQHFDVCLMCYEVNDYTKYIFPLKLNEYLATGRPTISAPIDAVVQSGASVAFASSDDDWLHAVDHAVGRAADAPELCEARRAFARAHEWDTLVERIAALLREAIERAGTARGGAV